jgi:hypothetical protein
MAPNVRMTVNNDLWRELKQLQPIQNYQLNIQTETEKATKTSNQDSPRTEHTAYKMQRSAHLLTMTNTLKFCIQTIKEKMRAFWDIVPCSLKEDRCFRGAYCLHHPRRLSSSYSPPCEPEISNKRYGVMSALANSTVKSAQRTEMIQNK